MNKLNLFTLFICCFISSGAITVCADEIEYPFEGESLCYYDAYTSMADLYWKGEFENGMVTMLAQPKDHSGVFTETGTYSASPDSIFITITGSEKPERTGIEIRLAWRMELRDIPLFYFTNAALLTMGISENDTVELIGSEIVSVEAKVTKWKEIKQMFIE